MRVLGLIPARGGSKGIPRKNIVAVAGRPLLAYTCEAALAARRLTRIVLSTEDQEIAEAGRSFGVEVPFLRPEELAQDETPSVEVAKHAVMWLAEHDGFDADVIVLLQPTSPLRRSHHIDEAVDLIERAGADTVVSVVEVPHRFSPYSIMQLQNGRLEDFCQAPQLVDRYSRQSLPVLYARNGPAVLAAKTEVLFERGSFYGEQVVPYLMDNADSIDIDTSFDLDVANWLLETRSRSRS